MWQYSTTTGKFEYLAVVVVSRGPRETPEAALESAGFRLSNMQAHSYIYRFNLLLKGMTNLLADQKGRNSAEWTGTKKDLKRALGHNSGSKGGSHLTPEERAIVFSTTNGAIVRLLLAHKSKFAEAAARFGLAVTMVDKTHQRKSVHFTIRYAKSRLSTR